MTKVNIIMADFFQSLLLKNAFFLTTIIAKRTTISDNHEIGLAY